MSLIKRVPRTLTGLAFLMLTLMASAQTDYGFDGTELDGLQPLVQKFVAAGIGLVLVGIGFVVFRKFAKRSANGS